MSSLPPLAPGTMINGTAEAMEVVAQTGAAAEAAEDLGGEKTSRALILVFHRIAFQLLTLQAFLIKLNGPLQLMMTMTENVKMFRMTWKSGRAQDNGGFPRIPLPLSSLPYLDSQIFLQKS